MQTVSIPKLNAFFQITEGDQTLKGLPLKPFQFSTEATHAHHHH